MNKNEFLNELRARLSGLPQEDIDERISFYSEMIDDRMEEDGITEADAVNSIGPVDTIVKQIMSEIPLSKIVSQKVKPKSGLKTWQIVLIVLGAPLWLPLLIALAATVLSIYVSIWSVVVSFYVTDIALVITAVAGIVGTIILFATGKVAAAFFIFGSALICTGLAILLFIGCYWLTVGVIALTKLIIFGIKRAFVGKES